MEEKKVSDPSGEMTNSVTRRDFCRKAIKKSSIALAAAVAGVVVAYKKPSVRSFFSASDAYAASTGAGKFSLKGDSN